MLEKKIVFLKEEVVPLLHKLRPLQKGNWGKMDAQQMVEHLEDVCKVANGKIALQLINTDPKGLAAARDFLATELPFQENTRVPVMPEEPRPHKYTTLQEGIEKVAKELDLVLEVYTANPSLQLMHPIFGSLDQELQIRYLYKHVYHHLRQFGLVD